jgi:ribosomal protein S12 methylthiotransferase accessory factor
VSRSQAPSPREIRPISELLVRSADALSRDSSLSGAPEDVHGLLRGLGYDDTGATLAAGSAKMLRAAARLRRIFRLAAPDAPGLVFFGAEADPAVLGVELTGLPTASLAGSGLTAARAFEACVGEGVEYLSQFDTGEHKRESGTLAERSAGLGRNTRAFLAACGATENRPLGWMPVTRLIDGATAHLPVDLCLRRNEAQRDFTPLLKLGLGCAAGISPDAAALHAILELIERDAAGLWWRGGRRGRAIAPDGPAGLAVRELLVALRQGREGRETSLLDITTDIGIPCVAAISARPDGYGFAYGLAARMRMETAVRAALFEMCQMELGQAVVAAKRRESGDAGLNEGDLGHLRRATMIHADRCALLHPDGRSETADFAPTDDAPAKVLREVVAQLARLGIETFRLDLTRAQFAIPVIRVLAPGLQPEPSSITSERLAAVARETGGGASETGGIGLF